jgi:hypothetical protein
LFLYFDFDRFCFFGSWQRNVKYAVLAGGVYLGGVNVVRQIQVAPQATVGPVEKIVTFFLLFLFMFSFVADGQEAGGLQRARDERERCFLAVVPLRLAANSAFEIVVADLVRPAASTVFHPLCERGALVL